MGLKNWEYALNTQKKMIYCNKFKHKNNKITLYLIKIVFKWRNRLHRFSEKKWNLFYRINNHCLLLRIYCRLLLYPLNQLFRVIKEIKKMYFRIFLKLILNKLKTFRTFWKIMKMQLSKELLNNIESLNIPLKIKMKIFKIKYKIIDLVYKFQTLKHNNLILINKIFKVNLDKVFKDLNLR
jgi:hypothetical protein